MLAGGIGWVILFAGDSESLTDVQYLSIVAFTLGITVAGLAYMSLAIRCPECRVRLFLFSLRHSPVGATMSWLLTLRACPRCGLVLQKKPPEGAGEVDS